MMAEVERRPEDVGHILVKVQEDLKQLKDHFHALKISEKEIDIKSIDEALRRTEEGIKQNTEYVFNVVSNQVSTLPTVSPISRQRQPKRIAGGDDYADRPILHPSLLEGSPGEKLQQGMSMKALLNPESLYNRPALNKSYGLVLPKIRPARSAKRLDQSVARGTTVSPLSVLPASNRKDPSLPPPPIQEKDAKKGILSLIQRGLIPPAAELTLDPPPVNNKRALLHDYVDSTRRELHSDASVRGEDSHYMASTKLDLTPNNVRRQSQSMTSQRLGTSEEALSMASGTTGAISPNLRSVMIKSPSSTKSAKKSRSVSRAQQTPLAVKVFETSLQPLPPPATPAHKEEQHQVVAASTGYSFFITKAQMPPRDDQDFFAFQQRYLLQWGPVRSLLTHLIKFLREFAVPRAYVNGNRLAELSTEFELEQQPTREHLLSVLENCDEIDALISKPGRRYMGPDGRNVAVVKVQSTWRRYNNRKAYLQYRRKRWAAGVIAISWIMHVRMTRMKKKVGEQRQRHINNYRARSKSLALDWNRLTASRRVIVHVPSFGYSVKDRFRISGLDRKQNAQMGRLCDLIDDNVDVIYVSPVEVLDELQQYYCKFLGLKQAVESGSPENVGDFTSRFTIVVPEAINKFPTHRMCLASLLKYSPNAMSRIKKLLSGRDAYYLPYVMHADDLAVADQLAIPVLGCEPEICHLYSSKSGSKRIFLAAEVSTPPSEFDVYTAQQLHESLSRLICDNPTVTRWLLKIDTTFDGKGIAYIDVDRHLPCYQWMVKESIRYGEKWKKKWAQETVHSKILSDLPEVLDEFACTVDPNTYPTWVEFLDDFLGRGGVIEACPPSTSVTCITVDMLIDPTGAITMTSCGDQIHAESQLRCWGSSVPQASVQPSELWQVSLKIAEACRSRGVIGYFSIDYVTFISGDSMEQVLWATDITLAYSNQMVMTKAMLYVSGGSFDAASCSFVVPPRVAEKKRFRSRRRKVVEEPQANLNRFAVMSCKLWHSNMAVVHYSVFFQMCRAHGIGFDIRERQGALFTLVDASKREELGMLCIGTELTATLASFAKYLSTIHQEISAPNMQGKTNFKLAIDDIESILGITEQNEEDAAA